MSDRILLKNIIYDATEMKPQQFGEVFPFSFRGEIR